MGTAIDARMRRLEIASNATDAGYLFVWPQPPQVDETGAVIPSHCAGAFYVGGPMDGQDVTDRAHLEAIYGNTLTCEATL